MAEAGTGEALDERLEGFVREWRRVATAGTLVGRLEHFLERAHPLFPAVPDRNGRRRLDVERLADLLPRLAPALLQGASSGATLNPWTASGLARREVRNAAVLAWLWSRQRCGSAGADFLGAFLGLVGRADVPLPGLEELALPYVVRTEHCPGADGADRVDIVVETARHLVGIEVKIDAPEGPRQLDRYVQVLERSAARLGKRPRVILLAPYAPSREGVLPATWAAVRAAAQASLPSRRSERGFAHQLIATFASHARRF